MEEFHLRAWEQLLGRMSGPLRARFILQPIMASLIAVRAGVSDARAHRNPYLWAVMREPAKRRDLLRSGWKDIGRVVILAFLVDCSYQFVVLKRFYPIQALIVAVALAAVPYVLLRGPAARVARRFRLRTRVD